jgi:hypothetical protein
MQLKKEFTMNKQKLIQSYVLDRYFVSTIIRMCSTGYKMKYYETITWELDTHCKQRRDMIDVQDSGTDTKTALNNHCEICSELCKKHEPPITMEEEQIWK